jgi:predicted TIM-barrel fold metal-dependent hydrolase
MLEAMIQNTNTDQLLFGTDWPFYHLGASLAKVLITTAKPERKTLRQKILRDNAIRLFPGLWGER